MKGEKLWNLVNTDKIEKEIRVRMDYGNCPDPETSSSASGRMIRKRKKMKINEVRVRYGIKVKTKGLSGEEKEILGEELRKALRKINNKRRCSGKPHLQHLIRLQ